MHKKLISSIIILTLLLSAELHAAFVIHQNRGITYEKTINRQNS